MGICETPAADLFRLADAIEKARKEYLETFGSDPCFEKKKALIDLLYNDKGTFASALRQAAHAVALAEAMDQLLDDMGLAGCSVCLAAKAQARIAFEPFRDKNDDGEWLMPLDMAKRILKESDR